MEGFSQRDSEAEASALSSSTNVELLLGPYRSGKTVQLIEELLDFKASNPFASALILVPSARYGRIMKERLNQGLRRRAAAIEQSSLELTSAKPLRPRLNGLFGVEIQPFYHACLDVVSDAREEPNIIPEEVRPALVAEILLQMKAEDKLRSLLQIAAFHGTSASLLELIDELQRAGLSPNELIGNLKRSSCRESHLLELASVYAMYIERLNELDSYDQKSLALAAREELFASGKSRIKHDLILIDGFDRISHLQAQVFAGLARQSRSCKVTFDYLPDSEIEGHAASLMQRSTDYRWKDRSYDELVRNLNPRIRNFAGTSTQEQPNSSAVKVHVQSLLDPYLEMIEVAREVKEALHSRQILPHELIVVMRSPDSYNGAIEAAFDDAGIPYFIDGSNRVVDLVPLKFIFSLLKLSENEFRRKDVADLLRSPYINLEKLSMTPREVSAIDRESYNIKMIGGLDSWKTFLSKPDFVAFGEKLYTFLASLAHSEKAETTEKHVRKIEDIVDNFMIFPASDHDIRSLAAVYERESIRAFRRVLKVLIQEEKTLELKEENFAHFLNRFEQLIDKSNYARPKPEAPVVTICSAELVPNICFKEMFVCGLVEGEFPRHQRAKGFLSTDEVQLWLSFGVDIRNPRQEAGFERALFYSLTERCTARLNFSYSQFSGKGEETIPSFYLTELVESDFCKVEKLRPFETAASKPVSPREALSLALWEKGTAAAESLSSAHDSIAYRWQNLSLSLAAALNRSSQNKRENPYNGYLEEFFSIGALSFSGLDRWTATKINDYGKCPFRFWSSHVLGLKPRDEAEPGLNFALVGQFYHKALELFFAARKEKSNSFEGTNSPRADWELQFDEAFKGALVWLENRADFRPGPYWQQEKKSLRFRLDKFLRKEIVRLQEDYANFQPSFFEVNFGTSAANSYPPLLIKGADGKDIVIGGSIDRIDLEPGVTFAASNAKKRARVIDYKSGSKRISAKEAELGRNLQLPIYALALERAIMPDHQVTEADYLSIGAADSVGRLDFENEKHAGLKELAEAKVVDFVNAAKNGIFGVKPKGQVACSDCDHAAVCRVKELKLQMEDENDAFTD